MLKGLHYAHTRLGADGKPLGLVHRDISPENVLVSFEGEVKLIDFGVAKAKMRGRQETEPGLVKGKYRYFSPEQAAAKELDARSDVYASGVVLYRCLGGRTPYEGQLHVVLRNLLKGEYPQLEELNATVPGPLAGLVDKALKTRREERFKSAGQFGEELSGFLHKMVPGFSAREVGEWMRWLFPEEAHKEGLTEPTSPSFLEQVNIWKPDPQVLAPDSVSGEMRRGTEQATAHERTPSAIAPAYGKKNWQMAAGIGALAVLLGVATMLIVSGNSEPNDRPEPIKVRNVSPKLSPLAPEEAQAETEDADAGAVAVKAKPEEKHEVISDEAAVSDVVFKLRHDHHRVRFSEPSASATFELEPGKSSTLRLKGLDTAYYAVLTAKGASAVGVLTPSVSLKGPVRVRMFDVSTGAVHSSAFDGEFNGDAFQVQATSLAQGISSELLVVRGLRGEATYKMKVRSPSGKKAVLVAEWDDAFTYKPVRHVYSAGETFEVSRTNAAGFAFVEGMSDEGDAELLFGQVSGPIDVAVARGACDTLSKLKRDPEATQLGQLTCGMLPKALAEQQGVDAEDHEDTLIDEMVTTASHKLAEGHYEEGKKILDTCTKKYLRSCRCPTAWRKATQDRREKAQGVMWKRVSECMNVDAANGGALPPSLRGNGSGSTYGIGIGAAPGGQ